jgi:hypothetical protein
MQTLHVQQRRVPTPYVDRGIDVGVVAVTTSETPEPRLAFARPRINDTTGRTGLAREPGRHRHHLSAALLHLVSQDCRELVPARVQDRSVQPRLLADVATGFRDGAFRAGGHAARVQVFEHSDTKAFGDVERGPVVEVAADARLPGLEARDAGLGPASAVRSALSPGDGSLRPALASLEPLQARGHRQHFARGEGEGRCNTTVDADHLTTRRGYLVHDRAGERDVPAERVEADGHVLHDASDRPAVAIFHPADLGQAHGRPVRVEPLHGDLAAGEAEGVVHAATASTREARPAREDVAEGAVEIAQSLLLARHVDGAHPVELGPQARQVGSLSDIPEAVLPAPGRPLLQSEVVGQSADARELPEQGLLHGQRFQLEAKTAGDGHGLFLSRRGHLTNHSRCADAQPPRPERRCFEDFR